MKSNQSYGKDDNKDEKQIVEHVNYFNVLMQSIQTINNAIMQGNDARDAAENLLSDLPEDWSEEIEDKINKVTEKYNSLVAKHNPSFSQGTAESMKLRAQKAISLAEKDYARGIKKTVISLLGEKDLLYQTRKKVEQGSLSLWALGEGDEKDE